MKILRLPLVLLICASAGCNDEPSVSPEPSATSVPANASLTDSSAVPLGKRGPSDSTKASAQLDTSAKRFFRGTGTEPFWSLSIDFTKSIIFKDVEGKDLEVPIVKGERAMDADVIRYASQGANGNLVVQIARQDCVNEMSGQKFEYTVTLDVQENGKNELRTFKGCGRYLAYDSLSNATGRP